MKSAALVSFAVLLGSVASGAQAPGQPPSETTVFRTQPPATACPVSLRAQHGATGGMLQADKGRPKGLAQLLLLTLTSPDSRQIVSARVRVRGLPGKAHSAQALSGLGNSGPGNSIRDDADVIRTLAVQFSQGPSHTATGDLWVPGVTAVLTIDLNSVTFADGSTLTFTSQDGCRIAPDHLMLVAGH